MRLIDADRLIERLPNTLTMQTVKDLIDAQPVVADCEQWVPKIQIQDHGFEDEPVRLVGDDPRHDWLEIKSDGSIAYRNLQCGEGTPFGYSFVPTFVAEDEYGDRDGKYITCRRGYILKSDWQEEDR